MDPFENEHQQPVQRPAIITIFAIFTLLGVVVAIIGSLIPSNSFTQGFEGMPELPPWINWVTIGLAGIKLAAAILLLKMKKMGFFLYVIAESAAAVVGIIGSRIMLDLLSPYDAQAMPISMDLLILISTAFSLVVSLVFILVYASQLNKMT